MKNVLFTGCLLSVFVASILAGGAKYMLVNLEGSKCGYVVNTRKSEDGVVKTSETIQMTIERLGFAMQIRERTTYIETERGEPLGFEVSQKIGNSPAQITKASIKKQALHITHNGEKQETLSYPKGALMPEGIRLELLEEGINPGTTVNIKAFDPSMQQALSTKIEIFDKEKVDLLGRVKELYKTVSTVTIPGTGDVRFTSYVDDDYKAYKSSFWLMGMTFEIIACEKEVAMSPDSPTDIFSKMLLTSPKRLSEKMLKQPLRYTLKLTKTDNIDVEIPQGHNQKVSRKADRLIVRVSPFAQSASEGVAAEKYIKANRYVQSDQESIRQLAEKAAGEDIDNPAAAAGRIEDFVHKYIDRKDLSVGYSTALETLESRQGDCSEHSVLTAALLRSIGLPAKVVTGVVYAEQFAGGENVFGAHAWTECLIDGEWVSLDATKGKDGFGSGHIKLAEGSGMPEDFYSLVNLLGNFEIIEIKQDLIEK